MAARVLWWLPLVLLAASCSVLPTPDTPKIVLLSSFEGFYREVGYNALYSAQMALRDAGQPFDLLVLDDGGTLANAVMRAQGITQDKTVGIVLLVGSIASNAAVQNALTGIPTLIVGDWHTTPATQTVVQLSNIRLQERLDAKTDTETGALLVTLHTQAETTQKSILTSGQLPDQAFAMRYAAMGEFVPPPNILATLVYDATNIAIASITTGIALPDMQWTGTNGAISFEDGWWLQAPVHAFRWQNDQLTPETP